MTSKRNAQQGGAKPARTTVTLSLENGRNLSELADRRNLTVDGLYVALGFAETVRKLLVEENEKRLKDLKSQRPGQ